LGADQLVDRRAGSDHSAADAEAADAVAVRVETYLPHVAGSHEGRRQGAGARPGCSTQAQAARAAPRQEEEGGPTALITVEATGETVSEAKWKALRELERLEPSVDKAAVRFQVLEEGHRGLLGVGYSPARGVATAQAREAVHAEHGRDRQRA